MPPVIAAGAALAASFFTVNTAITIGLGIAASVGASLLAPKPKAPAVAARSEPVSLTRSDSGGTGGFSSRAAINAPEIRQTIRQAVPPRRIVYGRALIGGAVFFQEVVPPHYYLGLLLSDGPITAVERIRIGSQWVSTAPIGFDEILEPSSLPFLNGVNVRLRVSLRSGEADQAIDPLLDEVFTSLSAEFRQRGIATAVLECDYGADADEFGELWGPGGEVIPQFVIRGITVYDPRDPTQNLADPSTWAWSDNATLCLIDYLIRSSGGRISANRIDWASVADSASFDDELASVKGGGFERRHTVNGVVTLGQRPYDVVSGMLTANGALLVSAGDMIRIVPARPREPVATIHDGMIVSGIDFRAAAPKRELVNRVRSRFLAEERDWQMVDGPVLDREDLRDDDDGGELLEATVQLPFTEGHRRAQRLARQYLEQSRLGRAVSLSCDLTALARQPGDVVRISSAALPELDGLYEIDRMVIAPDFASVEIQASEYAADVVTGWNAETDEQDFELESLDLTS